MATLDVDKGTSIDESAVSQAATAHSDPPALGAGPVTIHQQAG
jgi:hypothetical protein